MSNFIFLEGACIGFSSLGCMRVEKTGFEQDRINRFFCPFSCILGVRM